MDYDCNGALVANFVVWPTLVDQIRGKQMQDDELAKEVQKIMNEDIGENFWIIQDRVLVMKGKVCVPNVDDLKKEKKPIVQRMQCIPIVPKCTEPYKNYWWSGMKRNITEFVFKCLVCQQVKAKHQKPAKTL